MGRPNALRRPKFSLYDRQNNIEHDLFVEISSEFCDIGGFEILYYKRDEAAIDTDDLYGEPKYQNVTYLEPRRTKFVYQPTEEPTFTGMFGINSEEILQFAAIPKLNFIRDVGDYHPKPGDAIYTLWNDRAYEVVHCEEEEGMFLAGKFSWNFILRPFRYTDQSDSENDISTFKFAPSAPWRKGLNERQTTTSPLSGFGDNKVIEDESDRIFNYDVLDTDTNVYGF